MKVEEVLAELKALGSESGRQQNIKHGANENQYGVKMGDIRVIAKRIKTDHELGKALWETGIGEARLLATLILKPKALSSDDIDRMVRSAGYSQVAEWLMSYVVKQHPEKEALRQKWMTDSDPFASRAGWHLTEERIIKNPEGLDLNSLLDRIEGEMADAPELAQWTMNFCLGSIGINFPEHRERALAIGEKLGMYRDYPTSKGCTSPFVPLWIAEMVSRQGN